VRPRREWRAIGLAKAQPRRMIAARRRVWTAGGLVLAVVVSACGRVDYATQSASTDALAGTDADRESDAAIGLDGGALDAASPSDASVPADGATDDARPIVADGSALPTDGLLGHWTFDDPLADGAADSSGNGFDASCATGCPASVTGVQGMAGSFDGLDDGLRVPFDPRLSTTAGFTVTAFVRARASHIGAIVAKRQGTGALDSYSLAYDTDRPGLFVHPALGGSHDLLAPDPVAPGGWVAVGATWDGTSLRLWVEATSVTAVSETALVFDSNDLMIGVDSYEAWLAFFFQGEIDEVRLYSRALSAPEMALLAAR
jgi:hypothetical protein